VRPVEHVLEGDGAAGVELTYAEAGAGPSLVLLHGIGARWQVFSPVIQRLSDRWHMLALDFRGHGTSGRAPGRYRLEDFCDDALRVLDLAGEAPPVVYGHSLGGWVALSLAVNHPERVKAVVVGDSALYPREMDPDFAVSYLADLPLALRSLAKSLKQLDQDVLTHLRDGRLTAGFDPEVVLPQVACPVLLLQGDPGRGALMGDEEVEKALDLLPDGRHARFDGIGHGLHVEDAERVVGVLASFLDEVRATP
jgi:pimeloyl-ACP methyl ester carboxylesterase